MMKKLIKIILLIAVELLFLKCVLDLAGFQKLITEGPVYDKMIYLLYMKDYHWWYNLPIDIVEYRGISRDSDLVEIKTDEMEIRTVGTSLPENKTIIIRWYANGRGNLVYYIKMNKDRIENREMYFQYEGNYYTVYLDAFGQEEAQLLENATGKNESEIHEYIEQCDTNIGKFVEYLCHREKNNLLVQISIYIILMAAGFMGIIHIARKKDVIIAFPKSKKGS